MSEQKKTFIPNELKGSLFKNAYKEEGTSQPDYRGSCKIDGQVYEMAAWISTAANGTKFMSFNFQLPREQQQAQPQQQQREAPPPPDDAPF